MSQLQTRLSVVILLLVVYLIISIPSLTYFNYQFIKSYRRYVQTDTKKSNLSDLIINRLNKLMTPAPSLSDKEAIEDFVKLYPNMPIEHWMNNRKKQIHLSNDSCAPFPDMFALDVDKEYWQRIYVANETLIQVYSAHYDDRIENTKIVRIIAMVNRTFSNFLKTKRTLYCQLWFENEVKPIIAMMDKSEYMWFEEWGLHNNGEFGPYLLGCSIPASHKGKIPLTVSVVVNSCDKARNMLKVVNEKVDKKHEFAVCVKGLDFLQFDVSNRLVEWMEFLFLMGVHKVFFYQLEVHPRTQKALDYYVKQKRADVRQITISSDSPAMRFIQHMYLKDNVVIQTLNEIIHYNDCFYRNLYKYDYVVMLDIDEVIFPMKDKNWHDLISRTKKYFLPGTLFNCFEARHMYFMDIIQKNETYPGIPAYMHMMTHVYRSQKFSEAGCYTKAFFSTKHVKSCHNHYPISVFPNTSEISLALEDARMQHYRHSCHPEVICSEYTENPVKDTKFWDFKDELLPNVNRALTNMGLLEV